MDIYEEYAVCDRSKDFLETSLIITPVACQNNSNIFRQPMVVNGSVGQELKHVGLNLTVAQMGIIQEQDDRMLIRFRDNFQMIEVENFRPGPTDKLRPCIFFLSDLG